MGSGYMLGVTLFLRWCLGCVGLGFGLRFGFVYRAGDRFVVAENCAHQLRTGFQGFSSMVLEVWRRGFGF